MKQIDIVFGFFGTIATFTLVNFNALLGCIAGLFTVGVMALRFRKEWRDRNK